MADTAAAPASTKSPKKKVAASKAKKAPAAHPTYAVMTAAAIKALKERTGSSRQAILKYIMANFNVGKDEKVVNTHLKVALRNGTKKGALKQSKGAGASGSFRIGEQPKEKKPVKKASPKKKKPSAAGGKKMVGSSAKKSTTSAKKSIKKSAGTPKKPQAKSAASKKVGSAASKPSAKKSPAKKKPAAKPAKAAAAKKATKSPKKKAAAKKK